MSPRHAAAATRRSLRVPVELPQEQRRLDGVDSMVISLTAKGLTTGEIEAHLAEVYSTNISRETISKITDRVPGQLAEWQTRPLGRVYRVVFIDAIGGHRGAQNDVGDVGQCHSYPATTTAP